MLPIFSNSGNSNHNNTGAPGSSKKSNNSSSLGKPAMLSSRTALMWVVDRSRSQTLVSVWVSLLARLHNHILDDIGLQIHTEFLNYWPNILDE